MVVGNRAAMDTVTESALAIAIAREGGIGILHKNMSIEKQAEMVRKVKRADSGMIIDPVILDENATVGQAVRLMNENRIGGIPIVDKAGRLVRILTNRDLRFEKNMKRNVTEAMTKEKLITAPKGTDLKQAEKILEKYKIEKLPVVDKQGKLVGLITFKDILKTKSYPNSSKDKFGRLLCGAAVGVTADMLDRIDALTHVGVDVVCIDTAHGHSRGVLQSIKKAKQTFKHIDIVGGNVATEAGARALIEAGVDRRGFREQSGDYAAT